MKYPLSMPSGYPTPPVISFAPPSTPFSMSALILSYWILFTTGPMWSPSSLLGATLMDSAISTAFFTAWSYTDLSTIMRVGALQLCPVLFMQCLTPRSTAISSASAKMMFAPLPPSSSVTRLSVSAAFFEMRVPARGEPVKLTMSTSLCTQSCVPTPGPSPFTMLKTPGGKPALSTHSAKMHAFSGLSSDGLSTIVHPAIAAAPTFRLIWLSGQFHGVMSAHTPTASLMMCSPLSSYFSSKG